MDILHGNMCFALVFKCDVNFGRHDPGARSYLIEEFENVALGPHLAHIDPVTIIDVRKGRFVGGYLRPFVSNPF
jgi:hypothetical protein